jgi:hypothetical protein
MTKQTITPDEFRENLSYFIGQVLQKNKHFFVEPKDKKSNSFVVLRKDQFESMYQSQLDETQKRKEAFAFFDDIRKRTNGVNAKDAEKHITQAIKEVRSEE